jgi:myosin heavy subunit
LRQLKDNEKQILKKEQEIKDLSSVRNSLQRDIQEHKIKEQQLTQKNEKQLKETSEQLELKCKQLEKLSHIKESLEQDMSILKTENSNLRNQEETRKEKLAQLQIGRLYERFRSPISWTPTNDDWNKLFVAVEACFPNFAIGLQKSAPLNESEKKICYLIKIGVKPRAIAILLNLENASVYRKRLYKKLTGQEGNAKSLDKHISEL